VKYLCRFLLIAACILSSVSSSYAIEYIYRWAPSNNSGQNLVAGKATLFESTFDDSTNQFLFRVTFEPQNGVLPDGFTLVLNDGPNPKGHAGELAMLFFDNSAKAQKTTGDLPILTVYAYNGQNNFSAYFNGNNTTSPIKAPDRILSSLLDDSWIHSMSSIDQNGTRVIELLLDVTELREHEPAYPDPVDEWYGIGFGSKLGMWFHTLSGLNASYCTDQSGPVCANLVPGQSSTGFLKSWSFSHHGWYDISNHNANARPLCELSSSAEVLEIGQYFLASFLAIDPDPGAQLTVSYSGFPSGVNVHPANGSSHSGRVKGAIDWVPLAIHAGNTYNIEFTFTDQHGAEVICPLVLEVLENEPPVCDLTFESGALECGITSHLSFLNGAASFDPEGKPLSYSWNYSCPGLDANKSELQVENCQLSACPADFNSDGKVDGADLNILLAAWNRNLPPADLNGDGIVDGQDLTIFWSYWGACPEREECGSPFGQLELFVTQQELPVQCQVMLTVSDGVDSATCSVDVTLNADPADFDACGVLCGPGTNQCGQCGELNSELCDPCNPDKFEDQCGVCGGDGQSCLGCLDINISQFLFAMDGGAFKQLALNRKLARRITLLSRFLESTERRSHRRFARRLGRQSQLRYDQAWRSTWSLPQVNTTCENIIFCTLNDNSIFISAYNQSSFELQKLMRQAVRRANTVNRQAGGAKSVRRWIRDIRVRGRAVYQQNIAISASVPATSSSCS
jgi:hypothetical protein